jgi:hypothetical protein
MALARFSELHAEHFLQLPFTWRARALRFVPWIVRRLPLPYRPYNDGAPWPEGLNKLIRFSKEVMLLAAGRKAP